MSSPAAGPAKPAGPVACLMILSTTSPSSSTTSAVASSAPWRAPGTTRRSQGKACAEQDHRWKTARPPARNCAKVAVLQASGETWRQLLAHTKANSSTMADHWGGARRPTPLARRHQLRAAIAACSGLFIAKLMASRRPPPDALESALGAWSPLEIQFVATLSVATFLALLVCSLRCWVRHVQARALADLPPPEKGTVAVSYAWDGTRAAQRAQVPIAGVRTTASLIAAVCDHGAEIVDGEIAPDVVVVFFTDHVGRAATARGRPCRRSRRPPPPRRAGRTARRLWRRSRARRAARRAKGRRRARRGRGRRHADFGGR